MTKIGWIMSFWLLCFGAWGQGYNFVAKDTVPGYFTLFSVDNFGRIYLCQEDIIIQRYNGKDTLYSASLKTVRPTSMESSKSFRTLVFDRDRSVVHFFDNTLTDIHGEIDLILNEFQQPLLVCESFSGNTFWVLDGGMMRLVKLNQDLEVVSQTENLVTIFDDTEWPVQMLEYNDFLYILIPGKGVAIFDIFGTFIRLYPSQATAIGVLNNYLLLLTGNTIEAVQNDAFLAADFQIDVPAGVRQFMLTNQAAYLLTDKGLIVGELIRPDAPKK